MFGNGPTSAPLHSDALIETVVKWRMGVAYDAELIDWRSHRCLFERNEVLRHSQIGGLVIRPGLVEMLSPPTARHLDPWKVHRLAEYHALIVQLHQSFANDYRRMGTGELPIVAHVQDGNVFSFIEPHERDVSGVVATITPNRPVRRRTPRSEMIIVPRRHIANRTLTSVYSPIPWHKRECKVFWRGQLTGMRYDYDVDDDISQKNIRETFGFASDYVLRDREAKHRATLELARQYQRLRAVIDYSNSSEIDLALTEVTDERRILVGDFVNATLEFEAFKPRLTADEYNAELSRYKVRLAIPGNDTASSLAGDLLSDSAVLMPEPFHETDVNFGLVPWQHYVPVNADLSDLAEKLEWCRNNDKRLHEVALEGQRHASFYLEKSFEFAVLKRIFIKLAENTRLGG
jgi:hypothetical protein